jgi:hypothetical protein
MDRGRKQNVLRKYKALSFCEFLGEHDVYIALIQFWWQSFLIRYKNSTNIIIWVAYPLSAWSRFLFPASLQAFSIKSYKTISCMINRDCFPVSSTGLYDKRVSRINFTYPGVAVTFQHFVRLFWKAEQRITTI